MAMWIEMAVWIEHLPQKREDPSCTAACVECWARWHASGLLFVISSFLNASLHFFDHLDPNSSP